MERDQMTTFDDREKGFEKKFAHDQEVRFKAAARRNKLLGLWAAEKMGLSGEEAEAYARTVVKADLEEPGEEDVFRKIRGDFDARGIDQSDHQIRRTMDELMQVALDQIQSEAGKSCPPGRLEAEARERLGNGGEIARAEQAHMHQGRIQVVDADSCLVEPGLEGAQRLIGLEKGPPERAEHGREGELDLRMGAIDGRVHEPRDPPGLHQNIARPQVIPG